MFGLLPIDSFVSLVYLDQKWIFTIYRVVRYLLERVFVKELMSDLFYLNSENVNMHFYLLIISNEVLQSEKLKHFQMTLPSRSGHHGELKGNGAL